jgi:hypothetical protein
MELWPKDALKTLENDTFETLNPVVSTLAILSPITDMALVLALRPEMPEYNDPIMLETPFFIRYI